MYGYNSIREVSGLESLEPSEVSRSTSEVKSYDHRGVEESATGLNVLWAVAGDNTQCLVVQLIIRVL